MLSFDGWQLFHNIPQGPLASQLARSQAELTRLTTNLAMRTHPLCNSPSSLSNMPLNPPMPARMSSTCEHVIAKISQLLCRKCRLRTATTAESHESASRSGDRVIRLWLRHEASKGVSGYSRSHSQHNSNIWCCHLLKAADANS